MKKALLPILALAMVCCTPQRQETQHISITIDDTTSRKITIMPMGGRGGSAEMTREENTYSASVATSKTGFYNLVSVTSERQYILPYYVAVDKSESA
jgi:hypothetical protein